MPQPNHSPKCSLINKALASLPIQEPSHLLVSMPRPNQHRNLKALATCKSSLLEASHLLVVGMLLVNREHNCIPSIKVQASPMSRLAIQDPLPLLVSIFQSSHVLKPSPKASPPVSHKLCIQHPSLLLLSMSQPLQNRNLLKALVNTKSSLPIQVPHPLPVGMTQPS